MTKKIFSKSLARFEVKKFDAKQRIVFGFAVVSKVNGEDYYDSQNHHITEAAVMKAAERFADSARRGEEQHSGKQIGDLPLVMPVTTETAQALGMSTERTGLLVGFRVRDDEAWAKFEKGAFGGLSIRGYFTDFESFSGDDGTPESTTLRVNDFVITETSLVDVPAQGFATLDVAKAAVVGAQDINVSDAPVVGAQDVNVGSASSGTREPEKKAEPMKTNIFTLSADQFSYAKNLSEEDREKYLEASDDERNKAIETQKAQNKVLFVYKGREYRASDDADLIALARQGLDQEAKIVEMEKAHAVLSFKKEAAEALGNLPGTEDAKAGVLYAISKMDKETREAALAMLKAGNTAQAGVDTAVGTSAGDDTETSSETSDILKQTIETLKSRKA